MTVTEEKCYAMVDRILEEEGQNYWEGLLFSERNRNTEENGSDNFAGTSAWMMIEHVRRGYPLHGIRGSSAGTADEAYRGFLRGGTVYIEGKIDRIDNLGDDYVKVIDYKSGSDSYSEEEARAGWKLQLFVYLRAAAGEEKKPAGAFYFHISEPLLDKSKETADALRESLEKDLRKEFKMDGVLLNKEEVVQGVAGEFERYSDIVPVEKVKGSPKSTAKVLEEDEFEELLAAVSRRMEEMCREIARGDIAIEPRKTKALTACTYCEYKGICKFDEGVAGCEFVRVSALQNP